MTYMLFPLFPTLGHIPSAYGAWMGAWIESKHPGQIDFDPLGAAITLIALFAVAFLLGSIPWGVVISSVFYKKDIRTSGSGNIGATNAMRTLGRAGGIAVFVLDFLKGVIAGFAGVAGGYVLAAFFGGNYASAFAIALFGCTCGHIFCPWLGWRGGKGISVAFGCIIVVLGLLTALWILLVFLVAVLITRRISVGSISGAVAEIFFGFYLFWGDLLGIIFAVATGCIVIWAHRSNITRIKDGTEPRIGDKRKAAAGSGPDSSQDGHGANDAECASQPNAVKIAARSDGAEDPDAAAYPHASVQPKAVVRSDRAMRPDAMQRGIGLSVMQTPAN